MKTLRPLTPEQRTAKRNLSLAIAEGEKSGLATDSEAATLQTLVREMPTIKDVES